MNSFIIILEIRCKIVLIIGFLKLVKLIYIFNNKREKKMTLQLKAENENHLTRSYFFFGLYSIIKFFTLKFISSRASHHYHPFDSYIIFLVDTAADSVHLHIFNS